MDFNTVIQVLTAIALLIGIANSAWLWMSKGGAETKATLDKIESKLIDHDRRVQSMEGEMKHLPSKDDVAELKMGLISVNGTVNTLEREMAGLTRGVDRIEKHLLKED